jgi:phosphatidylserine/phosphatidylglycerophosphate/cardiolipin synthase-like enzyme
VYAFIDQLSTVFLWRACTILWATKPSPLYANKRFTSLHKGLCVLPTSQEQPLQHSPNDAFRVFWGGPDCPPRFLRDVLEARIHAVPSGGEIIWVTYYFRDEGLAAALLQASRRGVKVKVVVEGNPRTCAINNQVRKLLEGSDALGEGFRALSPRLIDNRFLKGCRLHEKLYYFSHPSPAALVGTFNPSGNQPDDPAVIREIGDQDRGHNVLVEVRDPVLVQGLRAHAQRMFQMVHGPWERFLAESNRPIASGNTRILFFPRSRRKDFDDLFDGLDNGCSLRMAVSHLNDPGICKRLFGLARQGVHIEILAHDTQRRVPSWVEKQMLQNGITFNRYVHPEGLPMHNKFMLLETPDRRIMTFGSMNLSARSLHGNHELLVISKETLLFNAFQQRWDKMLVSVENGEDEPGFSI